MKIIDINGDKLNACFVFIVGNCEISVSTIFNKDRPEIAIFDKHSDALLEDNLPDISAAIRWVNSFGPRD